MPKAIDMRGLKTGKITVIERVGSKGGQALWLCECECGNKFLQYGGPIRKGKIKSCGCLYRDKNDRARIARMTIAKEKHGDSFNRLYFIWNDIKGRCNNPNNADYGNYGGRGIKVCDEWMHDYLAFKQWATDAGYDWNAKRGECTIDRIDVNGDYSPDNCRWANMKAQSRNKRNTCRITYNGETHTTGEWSEITGISRDTIYSRYRCGMEPHRILYPGRYK